MIKKINLNFIKESKYGGVFITLLKNLTTLSLLLAALYMVSQNMEKRANAIVADKQKIAENTHQLNRYSFLASQEKNFSGQIQAIDRLLPKGEDLLLVRSGIVSQADRLGLLLNINFGSKEFLGNGLSAIKINLNSKAQSVFQIYSFLDGLQKQPFYLSIDSFNLEKTDFFGTGKIFIQPE